MKTKTERSRSIFLPTRTRKRASAKLARAKRAARESALEARFAAALEERTRLAREIHDSLLQGVTGIALQLRATLPRLKGAPAAVTNSIRGVVELAESTIRDARRAVWDMRAPSLVQKGLPDALEEAVRRTAAGNSERPFNFQPGCLVGAQACSFGRLKSRVAGIVAPSVPAGSGRWIQHRWIGCATVRHVFRITAG